MLARGQDPEDEEPPEEPPEPPEPPEPDVLLAALLLDDDELLLEESWEPEDFSVEPAFSDDPEDDAVVLDEPVLEDPAASRLSLR